ncbi:glycoside hydrolase family 5 protein [Hyunsoonleella sp. SJ7]|uniref:Glycoside hydrolase family 5 protein n=1 Tax=Hyunsoonleella aquatilis TaxID=2762758 RepID=A0A923KFZ4_9FLAO|nr:glycoside hydrolase family 5 protein [Hyunsoonleella aquatilis]MBC3757176.1 glycoside hydrolase family 5 protein [Hyunsoonleella aquatilis]
MNITIVPEQEETTPETNDGFASEFDDGEMRNISSFEIVSEMKIGWNLGNSLDAEGPTETHWGNPVTTKDMIDAIANRGFKTIRIPVTWRFHQGPSPNYTVSKAWLDRVEEVVNYARANNMYVILNTHHEDTWIIPTYTKANEVKNRLSKLWTQIATRFRNYSDYLIFETLNEPRYENTPQEWTGGTAEGRDVVNQYHQVCLDAIRATGGNNISRHVMISTYAASTFPVAINALKIPNNDDKAIVSLHSYFPFPFTLGGTDTTWGTNSDKQALDAEMDKIKAKFIDSGIPVVLGEWSSGNLNNLSDRITHAAYYANAAAQRGMPCVWWDNGKIGVSKDDLGIFNRRNLAWAFDDIADVITKAYQQ